MDKIIIANHKMNLNLKDTKEYIKGLKQANFKHIIFPQNIYISYYIENGIKTGIQNIYSENSGPYTGEISPEAAKSLGVSYTLLGHSERRRIFNETNKEINLKIKKALENNLKVILCIGDNLGEDYKEVLKRQIKEGLKEVDKEIIISYEPVYSIGTDIIPDKEDLIKILKYIKSLFSYDVKIFYGGSVNLKTAEKLKDIEELSGYLIGSGSLNVNDFIKIGEVLR